MPDFSIAAFYLFTAVEQPAERQAVVKKLLERHEIFGNVLIASEGINGTVAGRDEDIDSFVAGLRALPEFAELRPKYSVSAEQPFIRQNVRLKKEIVTLGVGDVNAAINAGQYVNAEQWNALLDDPDVLVIDARNNYEVALGSFDNAVAPNTDSFREFPDYVRSLSPARHKKVAMFCTGGIRCEKASAYMRQQGFGEVFHLRGGILKYLEDSPPQNRWRGDCFVFDDRVTVNAKLEPGDYTLCRSCRQPLSPADREHERYIQGVCCHHCADTQTPAQRRRAEERERQHQLALKRGGQHVGAKAHRDTARHKAVKNQRKSTDK